MPKRKTANTSADPTLPKTPVRINGKTYDLCFDLGALAEAETELNRQGHDVNLLRALPVLNLASVREIFPAAVRKFHPDLSFADAQKLVTLQSIYPIANAIWDAWMAAAPDLEPVLSPANPPQP